MAIILAGGAILTKTTMIESQTKLISVVSLIPGLPGASDIRDLKAAAQAFEAAIIRERLQQYGGNRAQAAESLGLPKRTLAHKCLKYQVTEL